MSEMIKFIALISAFAVPIVIRQMILKDTNAHRILLSIVLFIVGMGMVLSFGRETPIQLASEAVVILMMLLPTLPWLIRIASKEDLKNRMVYYIVFELFVFSFTCAYIL